MLYRIAVLVSPTPRSKAEIVIGMMVGTNPSMRILKFRADASTESRSAPMKKNHAAREERGEHDETWLRGKADGTDGVRPESSHHDRVRKLRHRGKHQFDDRWTSQRENSSIYRGDCHLFSIHRVLAFYLNALGNFVRLVTEDN